MKELEIDPSGQISVPYHRRDFGGYAESESHVCLHSLFEAQVALRPQAPALIFEGGSFSYGELNARANQLAHFLRFYDIAPGKFVGIFFERSAHPLIAILACLKTGAAYVPIDPAHPDERIRHILEESELSLILTEKVLEARTASLFSGVTMAIDVPSEAISHQPTWGLPPAFPAVSPSNLCYIIYTSGTTGRPKGVMTTHHNVVQFALAFNEICGTEPRDRVYQGFSLGFDGSVEEMWMAFSNGSALVVGTKQTPRFGNELAQFLVKHGVTYFSTVPTMLSTITDEIPCLRQLVVSGEACPPELVARWARPDLKMWNVYGPTEATVNTTVTQCVAGRPITIGRPLRGYDTYILDEQMRPVMPGEKGELYIGGEGLARGYFKQPELTNSRFVTSPYVGGRQRVRLYRTGDLVRLNEEREIEFFGRIDSQVKIRGYRVELSEIESVLLEHPRIRSASLKLFQRDGFQELAAFVVLQDPKIPLDRTDVLMLLTTRLPDYMIPGYLDVLNELPMLTSGKVDRSLLPAPVAPLLRDNGEIVEPASAMEAKIASVWAKVFDLPRVSVEDDFFLHLGGHSLLAAQMVTKLRAELGRDIAVRDAYRFPSVRKLATHLSTLVERAEKSSTKNRSSRAVFESLSRATRFTTNVGQAISLYFLYGIGTSVLAAFLLITLAVKAGTLTLWQGAGAVVLTTLLLWPSLLTLSVAAKWILIGRYQPGEYPVWGGYYFRWWLVNRIQALSGAGVLSGTPLLPIYYRWMGAKVGKNCVLDSALCLSWDLVSIGDETSVGSDTQLLGYRVENGMLRLGKIEIGKRCFVGIHSALGLNVRMEDDSRLDDQSLLPDGAVIASKEARRGSPAQKADVAVPTPSAPVSSITRALFGLAHLGATNALTLLMAVPALLLLGAIMGADLLWGLPGVVVAVFLSVPVGVASYAFYIAGLKRLVLGKAKPGTYSVYSLFYLRKWFVDELMKVSRRLLLPLYTTLYFPPWLRLLGAKIGKRAELSTVWYFSPEMLEVGEESFFADGSIVGGKRIFRGSFEIGINRIGRRSFVGNSAILPMGKGLGDQCLLGVLSAPPVEGAPNGTEWLGSPAFGLPNRQKVGNFEDSVTFRPTKKLYLQRALIDALRILIPNYLGLFSVTLSTGLMYLSFLQGGALALFLIAPFIAIATGVLTSLFVIGIKKAVMGTFLPVVQPLWSMYVWLNEMVNGIYESVMAPSLVPLLGTPFAAPLLRLIGCRIGRHTYLETTLFSEFDLVQIGDYCALNAGAIIQTHLFEDRVMKSASLKIGDECSIGNMAVVLYDTEMQKGTNLAPLSLVMKGETLTPFTRWHGIPSQLES
jgi:non-ribosomal peptide synthetase-like protein